MHQMQSEHKQAMALVLMGSHSHALSRFRRACGSLGTIQASMPVQGVLSSAPAVGHYDCCDGLHTVVWES